MLSVIFLCCFEVFFPLLRISVPDHAQCCKLFLLLLCQCLIQPFCFYFCPEIANPSAKLKAVSCLISCSDIQISMFFIVCLHFCQRLIPTMVSDIPDHADFVQFPYFFFCQISCHCACIDSSLGLYPTSQCKSRGSHIVLWNSQVSVFLIPLLCGNIVGFPCRA